MFDGISFQLTKKRNELIDRDKKITEQSKELFNKLEKINDKRRKVQEHDKKVEDALNLIRDAYDTLNEEKNGLVSVHKKAVDKLKTLQEKHEVNHNSYLSKKDQCSLVESFFQTLREEQLLLLKNDQELGKEYEGHRQTLQSIQVKHTYLD